MTRGGASNVQQPVRRRKTLFVPVAAGGLALLMSAMTTGPAPPAGNQVTPQCPPKDPLSRLTLDSEPTPEILTEQDTAPGQLANPAAQ
jgi:hypothetical protein